MAEHGGIPTPQGDTYVDELHAMTPAWVEGTISHDDARFLFARAVASSSRVLVEVGTASGLSTAVLAYATVVAGHDATVASYDINTHFYANKHKRVGDGAREILPPELLGRIAFHNPATASTVREHFGSDELDFAFIDASHRHPWPVLDLVAMLGCLRPGAEVVLHDVNLPLRIADTAWGAKYLFDGVEAEKRLGAGDPPNIGSIRVPEDKARFREALVQLIDAHDWEADIHPAQVRVALA